MTDFRIPDVEDLDSALARGAVRQQIAAANQVMALLAQASEIAQEHKLCDEQNIATLGDVIGDIRWNRDRLQDAVDNAYSLSERTADRPPSTRPTIEILRRVVA